MAEAAPSSRETTEPADQSGSLAAAQEAVAASRREADAFPASEMGTDSMLAMSLPSSEAHAEIALDAKRAELEAQKAFYAWSRWFNWWQLAGAVLIVLFALGIAATGAYFSYVQLRRGPESTTELRIGSAGVEVSTKVIGIVVLILAYLFFQIAAKHAFTVEVVTQPLTR
jgi:hypothetical protein